VYNRKWNTWQIIEVLEIIAIYKAIFPKKSTSHNFDSIEKNCLMTVLVRKFRKTFNLSYTKHRSRNCKEGTGFEKPGLQSPYLISHWSVMEFQVKLKKPVLENEAPGEIYDKKMKVFKLKHPGFIFSNRLFVFKSLHLLFLIKLLNT